MAFSVTSRAAVHAALGDPLRLMIADDLVSSDRSPKELSERLGIGSNLLAHHLDVLESAGVVVRTISSGDGRRKYVRLNHDRVTGMLLQPELPTRVLFLCTRNSARSQLASTLWRARTGRHSSSAGTDPAPQIHRGAIEAARRAGLVLEDRAPTLVDRIPAGTQVITVCDLAHEGLDGADDWWHWSISDPVDSATPAAFDRTVRDLDRRIALLSTTAPTTTLPDNHRSHR